MNELTGANCAGCTGSQEAACQTLVESTVSLINLVNGLDARELDIAEASDVADHESVSALQQATLDEAADLFDYRSTVLVEALGTIGCTLDKQAVNQKLRLAIGG